MAAENGEATSYYQGGHWYVFGGQMQARLSLMINISMMQKKRPLQSVKAPSICRFCVVDSPATRCTYLYLYFFVEPTIFPRDYSQLSP